MLQNSNGNLITIPRIRFTRIRNTQQQSHFMIYSEKNNRKGRFANDDWKKVYILYWQVHALSSAVYTAKVFCDYRNLSLIQKNLVYTAALILPVAVARY